MPDTKSKIMRIFLRLLIIITNCFSEVYELHSLQNWYYPVLTFANLIGAIA